MKRTSLPCWLAFLFIFFFVTWTNALAQIKFAQITDLHIYDGSKEVRGRLVGDDETNSKEVLRECIQKINELHSKSALQFVAATGDLGLEDILKGVLRDSYPSAPISEEDKKKLVLFLFDHGHQVPKNRNWFGSTQMRGNSSS